MAATGRKKKIKKVAVTGLWTKMKKWIREAISFVMESVFLWPEPDAKSVANFLLPHSESEKGTSPPSKREEDQYYQKRNYNFVKTTYESLFRGKMKGKEGKLVKLIKSKIWHKHSTGLELVHEEILSFGEATNTNMLASFAGSTEGSSSSSKDLNLIDLGQVDISLVSQHSILLYLGMHKTKNGMAIPHWLFGKEKLYGWIFVDHFVLLNMDKVDQKQQQGQGEQ